MTDPFEITEPGFYRTVAGEKKEVVVVLPERCGCIYPIKGVEQQAWKIDGTNFWVSTDDLIAKWEEPKDELYEWAFKGEFGWHVHAWFLTKSEASAHMLPRKYQTMRRLRKLPEGDCE